MMSDDGDLDLLWYFVPNLAVIAVIVGVIALWYAWRRRRDQVAAVASRLPISLLVVEPFARAAQRRGGVQAAVGLVGVPTMVIMEMAHAQAGGLGAIGLTIVACIGLRGFFVARGVLAMIEQRGEPVTAELDGWTLILRRGDEESQLNVSPAAIARARRHAVPRSIARRA
ncbi:MAG: hypothetical protein ABIY55_24765 [Kofleriaceae bacterium]